MGDVVIDREFKESRQLRSIDRHQNRAVPVVRDEETRLVHGLSHLEAVGAIRRPQPHRPRIDLFPDTSTVMGICQSLPVRLSYQSRRY